MKRKIFQTIIFLSFIAVSLVSPLSVSAEDGSGVGGTSEEYIQERWGFPPQSSEYIFNFCAEDQYGAQWHLTSSNGTITGYRDMLSDCVWNISGNNNGPNFHMELVLTSGTSCCTSGYTDGVADKQSRTAEGDTYWTGSCSSGPWPYYWVQC
ncbi:MAG TPA: hypothetical protein ENH23_05015 [candidate division Zixibacteria bacterium]|nr:hypothetical protein [candidate division Zixibacteria bacterium]